jgi:hypothetical protein
MKDYMHGPGRAIRPCNRTIVTAITLHLSVFQGHVRLRLFHYLLPCDSTSGQVMSNISQLVLLMETNAMQFTCRCVLGLHDTFAVHDLLDSAFL